MEGSHGHDDWLTADSDGELALDVYQNEHSVFVVAPVAGVRPDDIDISITDDVLTLRGERKPPETIDHDNYFTQECYWGPFSRSYVLPTMVNSEGSRATLKDGLLKIEIPKDAKVKTKTIAIEGDDEIPPADTAAKKK
ncbi:MAG: Hsp20/alpha crystallin family protein [Patescibacteria group bacterium]